MTNQIQNLNTLNYETLFSVPSRVCTAVVPSRVCTAVVIPAQAGIQVSSGLRRVWIPHQVRDDRGGR